MKKIRYIFGLLFLAVLGTGCAEGGKREEPFAAAQQEAEKKDQDVKNRKEALQGSEAAAQTEYIVDASEYFQGINGCAVLYREAEDAYFFCNKEQCEKEVSPLSSFKIVSALAGLEYGVLKDGETRMEYGGAEYPVDAWNGDLTLKEAFQTSCIWYFRQVVDQVGPENMLSLLKELRYGNCDISDWDGSDSNPLPELNGFWLDSSLKISPLRQVEVLKSIFSSGNEPDDKNIEVLKEIMYASELGEGVLYGKTGSGTGKAWFAGFMERGGSKTYLAVYLEDAGKAEGISGEKARELAIHLLMDEVWKENLSQ